jgi:hypothetical protein
VLQAGKGVADEEAEDDEHPLELALCAGEVVVALACSLGGGEVCLDGAREGVCEVGATVSDVRGVAREDEAAVLSFPYAGAVHRAEVRVPVPEH